MEVVREQPTEGQCHHSPEYKRLVVAEAVPYPIMWAARAIRAGSRAGRNPGDQFPLLDRVREYSPDYVDEDLWLPSDAVARLLEEFVRLRRVCRWEEFVAGLDGKATVTAWRGVWSPEEFERYLDSNERLLRQAVEGGWWVRLML
jgi:hypothetical protein